MAIYATYSCGPGSCYPISGQPFVFWCSSDASSTAGGQTLTLVLCELSGFYPTFRRIPDRAPSMPSLAEDDQAFPITARRSTVTRAGLAILSLHNLPLQHCAFTFFLYINYTNQLGNILLVIERLTALRHGPKAQTSLPSSGNRRSDLI